MLESASTIVVPVDFSSASAPLLREAAHLAELYGADIHMLHVYQDVFSVLSMRTFDLNEDVVEEVMIRELRAKCDALLDNLDTAVPVTVIMRKGETADEILDYVNEVKADLVVIATNARSGLEHFFIGSIAQRVVRYAPCPVVTLRAASVS
ncbi:MAG: universal stress protein [Bacteroidota bacterium]|nr:universal stress protein [Bacteroidota bacterium]